MLVRCVRSRLLVAHLRGASLCSRRCQSANSSSAALEESTENGHAEPEQSHPLGAGPVFRRGEFVTVRDQKDRYASTVVVCVSLRSNLCTIVKENALESDRPIYCSIISTSAIGRESVGTSISHCLALRVHTFRLEKGNAKFKNIRHDEILGAEPGATVDTREGGQVTAHRLSLEDYICMWEIGNAYV